MNFAASQDRDMGYSAFAFAFSLELGSRRQLAASLRSRSSPGMIERELLPTRSERSEAALLSRQAIAQPLLFAASGSEAASSYREHKLPVNITPYWSGSDFLTPWPSLTSKAD
jgi:hypothetical protein